MSSKLTEISEKSVWDGFVSNHPGGHPLQLWGWGEAKRDNGWIPYRLALLEDDAIVAGAQVLLWPIPGTGRFLAYIPRGPVAAPGSPKLKAMLANLVDWARAHKAISVRIEPAWTAAALPSGWKRTKQHIQLPETYVINLTKTEAEILEPMARKTRQYIRKAERDGVSVGRVTDGGTSTVYSIYEETAKRAGFGLHSLGYYEKLRSELGEASWLYLAFANDEPVAFLWLAASAETAYELYGGVTEHGQELKANYLLKWRAIDDLKDAGYRIYDFNGRLNEGVSQFKVGFGPDEVDYVGTYDYAINKAAHFAWQRAWPLIKPLGRRLKRAVKR